MYLAKAKSIGSLIFRPINCKLIGNLFSPNFIGKETAGTPFKV